MRSSEQRRRPVVYYSTNHDWFGYDHFYQGLARTFAASRPLLYVRPPLSRYRKGAEEQRLQQVGPQLWLLRPWIPRGFSRLRARRARDWLVARAVTRALRELGIARTDVLVWAYTSDAAAFIRDAPLAKSVYWTGDEVVDPYEDRLLECVDHVFTVSPLAADDKRAKVGERMTQMPMAVDPGPYEAAASASHVPADLQKLPRPFFGYGGAVNSRIDWDLLRRLADATTGSVIVVGPATDHEGREQLTSSKPPNLHLMGNRDPDVAPNYVAAFDVGLIPYRLSRFNLGSNPVKTYQYLAAGLPVVATALPALEPLSSVLTLARTTDEFIGSALLASSESLGTQRAERQLVARQHSYDNLVRRVDDALGAISVVG